MDPHLKWFDLDQTNVTFLARMNWGAVMAGGNDLHTPAYWYERADEARARAGAMDNADSEKAMLEIARIYDRMAKLAKTSQLARARQDGPLLH